MAHAFSVGQRVLFTPHFHGGSAPGTYEIVRLLPIENDARVNYRIKNTAENFERIAEESQLSHLR